MKRITYKVGEWPKGRGTQLLECDPNEGMFQAIAEAVQEHFAEKGIDPVTISITLGVEASILMAPASESKADEQVAVQQPGNKAGSSELT